MPFFLSLLPQLKGVNIWRVTAISAGGGLIALALFVHLQAIDLAKDRVVYEHPKVVHVVQTRTVQGPIRIVTRTIRTPGREEVTTEETRGPAVTTVADKDISEPILAPRTDRWLLGGGPSWRYGEVMEWSVLAGRSFDNRIDLLGGVSQRGRVQGSIIFRF